MSAPKGPGIERQEQIAHLRDYWRIVWRHRWTVAAVAIGIVIFSGIWTFLQTPIYRATATVEAQARARQTVSGPDISGIGSQSFGWAADERFYSTQIEILRSREMARRVVRRLGLDADPAFAEIRDPARAVAGMISVGLRKDTGIVEISMSGPDPARAAELANAYAHEYVERNLEEGRRQVKQAVEEMRKQIEPIRQDLEAAESARFGIAQKQELYVPENQKEILQTELQQYNSELTAIQVKMNELAGQIAGIEDLEANKGDPLAIPLIAKDEDVRTLVASRTTLQRDLEGLKVKYRPGHPAFQETQSKLDAVQDRLDARIRELGYALKAERLLYVKQASGLQEKIAGTRRRSLEVSVKTSGYDIAKSDVESQRNVYDALLKNVSQINLQASLLRNNLSILDEAAVPTAPIKPRTRLNLALGAMMGLMLGFGAAFFIEYFDNTIKSADDIENILGLHLLAVIPKYREKTGHAVREAYQTLRTSVLFSSKGRQNRLLLVTSAGPREGKTSTVVNLARTIASAGEKVVLLDCDLRRPKIHEDLALEREPGLTNYLAGMGDGDYRQYLKATALPTLSTITCGPIPPNPPELFGSEKFRNLLAQLREDFDWVLIDSPPASSLTDAVILSSMAEMVAFVVKHNENDRDLIRRCVGSIRNINPNIIGAVLNNVDIDRAGADYYYAGYYYYTAEGEEGKKKPRRSRKEREHAGLSG